MSSNKTDIQTKIDTINDGGVNTAAVVRDVFGTNIDSILEAFYPTVIEEISDGVHVVTEPTADFSYSFTMTKIGRTVSLTGKIIAVNTVSNAVVADIDAAQTDFYTDGGADGIARSEPGGAIVRTKITGNQIIIKSAVIAGEGYFFNLTYNTLN